MVLAHRSLSLRTWHAYSHLYLVKRSENLMYYKYLFPRKTTGDAPLFPGIFEWKVAQPLATVAVGNQRDLVGFEPVLD